MVNEVDQKILSLFLNDSTKHEGFTLLVNTYKERLYWQIRRIVIHHEDSDDVLQNVFIKCWRSLNQFRKDAKLYTWIYRIAVNESISHLKKKRDSDNLELTEEAYRLQAGKADFVMDASEIEIRLENAILQLPEKQRIVFHLKYFENLKYDEIAEITDTSIGALKASYFHAVQKIKDLVKRD